MLAIDSSHLFPCKDPILYIRYRSIYIYDYIYIIFLRLFSGYYRQETLGTLMAKSLLTTVSIHCLPVTMAEQAVGFKVQKLLHDHLQLGKATLNNTSIYINWRNNPHLMLEIAERKLARRIAHDSKSIHSANTVSNLQLIWFQYCEFELLWLIWFYLMHAHAHSWTQFWKQV